MTDATNRWRGRRVLVAGCTGFLGGAVVRELLTGGVEVVGLVRDRAAGTDFARHALNGRVHVVHGRVEDTFRLHSALAIHDVVAVFNLTSANPNQPDRGTAAVVEAVRRFDPRVPVVIARPTGSSLATGSPVPLGVARFGEVYGGGDRNTFRAVPASVVAVVSGDRSPTPTDGPTRDFVFVRDAARACVRLAGALADRPEPRIEDLTFQSGCMLTDRAVVNVVRDVFQHRGPIAHPAAPPANPLGWAPEVSLTDGLAETIAWYREFLRTRFFGTKAADSPRRAAA